MTSATHKKLNDSTFARWSALILISLLMFFGYMFTDVLSPLATMFETERGWMPETYGTVAGSGYFLNVFVLFLIFAGIILDKMGIRFTGLLSGGMMLLGAAIKVYGISDYFIGGGFGWDFFNSFWPAFPATAKVAAIGFAIFGCGVEMAGVTVSKTIAKWFKGKEMALAMGIEMAIARLGVFAVFTISPSLAEMAPASVVRPVAIVGLLLVIGVLSFLVFAVMDRKLDKQMGVNARASGEAEFKISDLKKLFTSRAFLVVAFLCVLYYSAIFPFQKFAVPMLENSLGISSGEASRIFRWFPIGAMILTPALGYFIDHVGKAATMLMAGSLLMLGSHLIFALVPLTPAITITAIVILGISFSLVPASLWPSVPKLVESRYLGSGFSVIFWIQNIGLWGFPIIIGSVLQASNPGVAEQVQAGMAVTYDYTVPMLVFASLGVMAFMLGFWLKALDKKHGYGLEQPNVKKK
jgi:MFS family permease